MAAAAAYDELENKRAHAGSQCWSATFPDDLLALVYSMIASPRGRVRFAAVCRSWRAAARAAPPVTALPWLLLLPRDCNRRKALHCLEDSSLVRLWVLREDAGRRIIGGHDGGWVAMPVPGLIKIVNLFSGAEVRLAEKNAPILCTSQHHGPTRLVVILRVIFSAPPTSPRCILAAITYKCGIALCRVGGPNNGWTVQGCPDHGRLVDIAFCNDELYGLRCYNMAIVKFEIGVNEDGARMVITERPLVMQWIDGVRDYSSSTSFIFDLHGKLGLALKTRWLGNTQPFFKVFSLVDNPTGRQKALYKHEWVEVIDLGDHSLFLGETFSKAVHVPTNMCGNVERNHIYYSHRCPLGQDAIIPSYKVSVTILNNLHGETSYKEDDSWNDITNNGLKRIRSVGYFMKGHSHGGMWILPPYTPI
ncbi:uncharacterized protein [Aegilops tauschii subsp. strangulata]|uniref:uncharacterized protein n=1 Tax=Aegilops tauschii subsp. strangulata TaxID=200361 RepID=UPI00098A7CAF|nr:uncharacterized protein LOC109748978 [Aegilops tauschii subsp. strangulata]